MTVGVLLASNELLNCNSASTVNRRLDITASLTTAVKPNTSNHLVKIHCKTCKVNTGVTIAYLFPEDYTGKTKFSTSC